MKAKSRTYDHGAISSDSAVPTWIEADAYDREVVNGKDRNEKLNGTNGNDKIDGKGGNDTINGKGGNDKLIGGSGNDTISGGAGNDVITDVSGKNRLSGNAGNDRITGGKNADRIDGGTGNDTLNGGAGDDTLIGGTGENKLSGGDGVDTAVFTGSAAGYTASYDANGQLTLSTSGSAARLDSAVELIQFGNEVIDRRIIGTPVVTSVTTSDGEVTPGSTTTDSTLVINGTSNAFARVAVYDGNYQIGVTVAGADGLWSFDYSRVPLSHGDHAFSASASYGDGLPSMTGAGATFTIDATTYVIDLGTLSASQGFIFQGTNQYDQVGCSVSSAGDVNGDGFEDFIVGALGADDGGKGAGAAYVIFGTASGFGSDVGGRRVLDPTALTASQGFVIRGDAGDYVGDAVSSAGDVNGDGFDDLIVGAKWGDDGAINAGQAYVIFGTASGFGSNVGGRRVLDLSTLTARQGFVIQGDAEKDYAGSSLSSAGDINGDGFDDLIVGANWGDDGGIDVGQAYVIFGTASGFGIDVSGRKVIHLAVLTPDQGFIVEGDEAGELAGYSVSSAGDVNGDGFDDLIVGAPLGSDAGHISGEAYVIFGTASGFGTKVSGRQVVAITDLTASQGFIIQGEAEFDLAGYSVSSAGDINGDGFDDLTVGAANSYAYVIFGTASGFGTDVSGRQVIDLTTLTASQGFVIGGNYEVTLVSSAGDINGDGFDDVIVGSYNRNGGQNPGHAVVVFGAASGIGSDVAGRQVIDVRTMTTSQGFTIQSDADFDGAGKSVSSAGDINGDGFDDLIVGASGSYGGKLAGRAYVLYGGSFGNNAEVINLTGTSAAEILMGNAGNDTLSGKGGADIYRSGAGNDRILISDANFRLIDAGSGKQDIVVFADTSFTLDARSFSNTQLTGIEGFDLTQGHNTLKLAASDVFHFSTTGNGLFTGADSHNNLVVDGNSGDTLQLFDTGAANADWVSAEVNRKLDGTRGGDYTFVNLVEDGTHRVLASIAVDHDVTLVL